MNDPWAHLGKQSRFADIVATDYRTGPSMHGPVRRYNVYRNQLSGGCRSFEEFEERSVLRR